ncbi:hypothetical protein V9654_004435 [Vibrio parahaemolyticus]|nr:hypothetical protein [Vibrio parahaemolyticus]
MDFLAHDWVNEFFGIVGVIGTFFGVISWYSAKKTSKSYNYLLKVADMHVDKSYTEDQLTDSREKVKRELEKINLLQTKIKNEIPIEARRAVLRDKLETKIEQLHDVYSSLHDTRLQLEKLGDPISIPLEIQKSIDSEIQPEYLKKRRKAELRNYLTIITTIAAISSALLPYPFSRYFSWFVLGVIGVPALVLLAKLYSRELMAKFNDVAVPFIVNNLFFIGLCLVIIGIGILSLNNTQIVDFIHSDYILSSAALVFIVGIIAIIYKCVVLVSGFCKKIARAL